jgi:hypothetical protein
MAEILQGGKRDTVNTAQFAVTNITQDYALDCNGNDDLATADVLGTLIRELIRKGIINGTVA